MFIIFGGCSYYASGGANDILAVLYGRDFSIEKAKSYIGMKAVMEEAPDWDDDDDESVGVPIEWVQVYDVVSRETIYKSEGKPYGEIDGITRVESK
jgi:hypothetical protein